ncbi:MAG TPA: hypothetical protein VGP25_03765 [Gemmatimonadaceae bacterium]|nr:hypothetical protein [Gemmatimonadaceae bacterium]
MPPEPPLLLLPPLPLLLLPLLPLLPPLEELVLLGDPDIPLRPP